MSLVAGAAARRVDAHADEHFRVVDDDLSWLSNKPALYEGRKDDDLFALAPRARVAGVLDPAQPHPPRRRAVVVVDRRRRRKWLVEERRERAVAATLARCTNTPRRSFGQSRLFEEEYRHEAYSLISPHLILILTDPVSSALTPFRSVALAANWVASQRTTRSAMAGANHRTLGSDDMRSVELR